ncbi:phospholipase D-like domain-containing protein [Marinobacterium aestuariivivens]|uniref:Phospholipase D-like domain-containing protein n=1 Tax=Marinobacterium aestuariivivens TaxID=1698799 RepID=A0ABW1ZXP1_9GAMM
MHHLRGSDTLGYLLGFVALLSLAGCATEPRLDVTRKGAQQPTVKPLVLVEDGQRAASPWEYRQLLARDAPNTETQAMLDQLLRVSQQATGQWLSAGNEVRVLVDGPATFDHMFDDIARAVESIHLETFILDDTEIGKELAQQLIASRQRGVDVRVLIDAVGSADLPSEFVQHLRDHAIEVHWFRPFNPIDPRLWRLNSRNHRKLLIIDGRIAYSGGINFSGSYSKGSFSTPPIRTVTTPAGATLTCASSVLLSINCSGHFSRCGTGNGRIRNGSGGHPLSTDRIDWRYDGRRNRQRRG